MSVDASGGGGGSNGGCVVLMITMTMMIAITLTMMLTMTDYYDAGDDDYCFSISHLERDLSQKRVLMDDIKLKLTTALENAETDANVMVL